ncbi:MAG: VCBS repeat-containing protein [Saprospiraceae bacterium]|nr:VCBS repeat-containing protein [Saprospiraceae bacterium]
MKRIFFFLLLGPGFSHAQLYSNASQNLPDNGSMGQSMDVRAADLDQDGDLDIVLANEFQPNTLLLNDGNGVFSNGTIGNLPQENHDSEDVAIADFNNDGHLDLFFCSEDDVTLGWTNVHEYYLSNGAGHFAAASYLPPDSEANAVIAADLNTDGLPDLLLGNKGPNLALINVGNGNFTAESQRIPQAFRTTQDLAMADVDGDGDLDLMEGNEDGNLLHINNGSGFFTNETDTRLPQNLNIETRKVTFGDVDSDGDVDVFLSNVGFIPGRIRQNRLFLNDGTGHFTDATTSLLPADNDHTIDAIFEDVDLDGDLDLVIGNVFGAPVKIYGNNGTGLFTDVTDDILGQNYFRDALGVIAADFNGDGLRDLYICDRKMPQTNNKDLLLLRNPLTTLGDANVNQLAITVFPNPVNGDFFIKTNLKIPDTLGLTDRAGRIMHTFTPENQSEGLFRCPLPKGKLIPGIYFIEIGKMQKLLIVV